MIIINDLIKRGLLIYDFPNYPNKTIFVSVLHIDIRVRSYLTLYLWFYTINFYCYNTIYLKLYVYI